MVSVRTASPCSTSHEANFSSGCSLRLPAARTPFCAKSGTWTGASGPGESDHPDPIGLLLIAPTAPTARPAGGATSGTCPVGSEHHIVNPCSVGMVPLARQILSTIMLEMRSPSCSRGALCGASIEHLTESVTLVSSHRNAMMMGPTQLRTACRTTSLATSWTAALADGPCSEHKCSATNALASPGARNDLCSVPAALESQRLSRCPGSRAALGGSGTGSRLALMGSLCRVMKTTCGSHCG